ncbi:Uu.00g116070.m01.CDS01 [Anthostomella pinea]|uniref:Uu.00g116070.m01.CDS01 n=1 Tax=Anthostomella pinea TaxID=933095 RepID=A0AAI8YED7_9PEZI|nr:Uu.00g116070.m01.CDS01 [Anthostomella pinea]
MSSQWSQGVVPPPAGVTPNFVDPPNQMTENIAIHTVFLTLSTLAVAMRIYTRVHISRVNLGADDLLRHLPLCTCKLLPSLELQVHGLTSNRQCATAAWSGLLLECFHWGIGRHIWEEPATWLVSALKFQTIASQVYLVAATAIKLSLLFLYRRLFNLKKKAKYFVNGGIVVVLLMGIALLLAIIFFCTPVRKAWDDSVEGHCSDPAPVSYLSGVWNAAVDVYVLILPVPLLWGLNMSPRQKLRLGAVFGIGIFACAASLVRLGFTPLLQSDLDSTYNIASVSVWATLEINVGLICSCLMLLPAFLRYHLSESTKSYFCAITLNVTRSGRNPSAKNAHQWQGYHHKVHSDPRNLVVSGGKEHHHHQITRTDTFTLETIHVPADLERGATTHQPGRAF